MILAVRRVSPTGSAVTLGALRRLSAGSGVGPRRPLRPPPSTTASTAAGVVEPAAPRRRPPPPPRPAAVPPSPPGVPSSGRPAACRPASSAAIRALSSAANRSSAMASMERRTSWTVSVRRSRPARSCSIWAWSTFRRLERSASTRARRPLCLVDHGPALLAGVGQELVRLVARSLELGRDLLIDPLEELGHGRVGLGTLLGQAGLGPGPARRSISSRASVEDPGRLGLRLGHHLRRRLVGTVEHPGRLRPEGRR